MLCYAMLPRQCDYHVHIDNTYKPYGMHCYVPRKVLDWMEFRFGAAQSVDFYESATATNLGEGIQTLTEHSEVVTHVATGLGFNVPVEDSVLRMDINVNPLQLLRIPHLWSGETMGAIANNGQYGVSASIQYDW